MSHLNYFRPFDRLAAHHENQLTRAFLVVLKYCPLALLKFYDAMRESCIRSGADSAARISDSLPPAVSLDLADVEIETQRGSLPSVGTLVSVLLTDDRPGVDHVVTPSNRSAVYDGILRIGELILFLENKPANGNVWFAQLDPGRDIAPDANLIPKPAILVWRDLISMLGDLGRGDTLTRAERLVVADFLELVDSEFPSLNPFNRLDRCKRRPELVGRRINAMLGSLARDETAAHWHKGWGYCIDTGNRELRKVGLLHELTPEEDRVRRLVIAAYVGEAQNGAADFYGRRVAFQTIQDLRGKGWEFSPNFHLGHVSSSFAWMKTPPGREREYYEYWVDHCEEIHQRNVRDDLEPFLRRLDSQQLIRYDEEAQEDVNRAFLSTNRRTANVCPAFGLFYAISIDEAEERDRQGELEAHLAAKMREVAHAMGQSTQFLKS